MNNITGMSKKFEISFIKFDNAIASFLSQINENYRRKIKQDKEKQNQNKQQNTTINKTKKQKIVHMDMQKIKEAIEQATQTAKANRTTKISEHKDK